MTLEKASHVADVLAVIAERSGLVFPELRGENAARTIETFLSERGLRDASDVVREGQLPALLEQLVVHESFFDRDLEQLAFIDTVVLPELAKRGDNPLRLWSAGCAGGEEAYTLAFMLARKGLLERSAVHGTDLSEAALIRARRGRYRAWSARLGPASPAAKFLESIGDQFQVPSRFLRAVTFSRLNLIEDPYPPGQHLITCRNVLIYFDKAAVERVANKLAHALAPDGWIAVGPSDPRLDQHAPLEPVVDDRGVFYRPRTAPRRPAPVTIAHVPRVIPEPSIAAQRAAPLPPAPPPAPPPVASPLPEQASEIRRLADVGDGAHARTMLASSLAARPLDAELHFLSAVLATERDPNAALAALARCTYLDPTKAAPQLLAASLWRARGNRGEARKAFRSALAILSQAPATDLVPWVDETAGPLMAVCRRAMEILDGPE